jgi:predicted KAP-like P-loop ATPase
LTKVKRCVIKEERRLIMEDKNKNHKYIRVSYETWSALNEMHKKTRVPFKYIVEHAVFDYIKNKERI